MKHHRQMRFSAGLSDIPRLRTTGPKDNFFSKNRRARGGVQRVGAGIFATLLLLCSVASLLAGVVLRAQVSDAVDGVLGLALGTGAALVPFLVACALIFFAVRLIKGVSRSFHK